MKKSNAKRERLSIDILPEEHRKIKAHASILGTTIREYVLKCIHEHWQSKKEENELLNLTLHPGQDPVLKEVCGNQKDATYDRL